MNILGVIGLETFSFKDAITNSNPYSCEEIIRCSKLGEESDIIYHAHNQ